MPVSGRRDSETRLRSQVANAAKRHYKHPTQNTRAELDEARAALAFEKLERHVEGLVDQAPALSEEARSRLASILRGLS